MVIPLLANQDLTPMLNEINLYIIDTIFILCFSLALFYDVEQQQRF